MSKYMDGPPKPVVNLAGGCCGEVVVKERFKQESMYGLSAKKWPVVEGLQLVD